MLIETLISLLFAAIAIGLYIGARVNLRKLTTQLAQCEVDRDHAVEDLDVARAAAGELRQRLDQCAGDLERALEQIAAANESIEHWRSLATTNADRTNILEDAITTYWNALTSPAGMNVIAFRAKVFELLDLVDPGVAEPGREVNLKASGKVTKNFERAVTDAGLDRESREMSDGDSKAADKLDLDE